MRHGGLVSLLGQFQRHQVGVKERHVGDVRAGVVKAGQGVLVEQKAECGLVVLVGDVGIKAEAFIVGAHHVQHKVGVVAQYLGEQIKRFAFGIRACRGALATVVALYPGHDIGHRLAVPIAYRGAVKNQHAAVADHQ